MIRISVLGSANRLYSVAGAGLATIAIGLGVPDHAAVGPGARPVAGYRSGPVNRPTGSGCDVACCRGRSGPQSSACRTCYRRIVRRCAGSESIVCVLSDRLLGPADPRATARTSCGSHELGTGRA